MADPANQPKTVTAAAGASRTRSTSSIPTSSTPSSCARAPPTATSGSWASSPPRGLYGKTLQDIDYKNLNFNPPNVGRATGADHGPPGHDPQRRDLPDQPRRATPGRSTASWAAVPQRAPFWRATSTGARSPSRRRVDQAASNFANNYIPGNPNEAPLTESRFSPGHRINLAVNYEWKLPRRLTFLTTAYYNGQSGRPYTFLFLQDVNADTKAANDLVFIPSSADQVLVTGGTSTPGLIDNTPGSASSVAGSPAALRGPWTNRSTSRPASASVRGVAAWLRADVVNFLNLSRVGLDDFCVQRPRAHQGFGRRRVGQIHLQPGHDQQPDYLSSTTTTSARAGGRPSRARALLALSAGPGKGGPFFSFSNLWTRKKDLLRGFIVWPRDGAKRAARYIGGPTTTVCPPPCRLDEIAPLEVLSE